jgi:homocysteine S-methyltransferase
VPGISIPEVIQERMYQAGDMAPKEGIKIALELIEQLRPWAGGVYMMPQFGRYDLAAEIVEGI